MSSCRRVGKMYVSGHVITSVRLPHGVQCCQLLSTQSKCQDGGAAARRRSDGSLRLVPDRDESRRRAHLRTPRQRSGMFLRRNTEEHHRQPRIPSTKSRHVPTPHTLRADADFAFDFHMSRKY